MGKVLAIDDRNDNLTVISAMLRNLIPDCTVQTVQSGAEGIEKACSWLPDTIILDIHMPGMDGFEVCRRLKAHELTKHIPVIMLTAVRKDSDSRVKALNLGADSFLSKPINESELIAQVNVMLRIKKNEDLLRREKDLLAEQIKERTSELIIANKKMQENQVRLQLSIEAAHAGTWIWNVQTGAMKWDDRMQEIFGLEPGTFAGTFEAGQECLHPEDLDAAKAATLKAIEEERHYQSEYRVKARDGGWRMVNSQAVIIKDDRGKPLNMVGIVTDITERKKAEEELRESEMLNRSLLEGSPVCNKIIDLDFKLRYMSNAGLKQLKIPDIKPYYGQTYPPKFYPESMRAPLIKSLKLAMAGKISSVEAPVHDMEGNEVWYHTTFVPAFDDDGRVKYVIGSSVNITDRKLAEEERIRLATAIEQADEIVIITDKNGTIQYTNPAFTHITGYSMEEAIGQNPRVLKSGKHPDSFYEQLWDSITNGKVWRDHFINKKKMAVCTMKRPQFLL